MSRLKQTPSERVTALIRKEIRRLEKASGYPDHTVRNPADAYAYSLMLGALMNLLREWEGRGSQKGNHVKIVINKCFGGFSLSPAATKAYYARKGKECYFFRENYEADRDSPERWTAVTDVPTREDSMHVQAFSKPEVDWSGGHWLSSRPDDRADPDLVAVVEELGEEAASGSLAKLRIVEVPDGVDWELDEYNGIEHVAERHRTWG